MVMLEPNPAREAIAIGADQEWEYAGPYAPSGNLARIFQGQWIDSETGDPIAGPRYRRRRVGKWEDCEPADIGEVTE